MRKLIFWLLLLTACSPLYGQQTNTFPKFLQGLESAKPSSCDVPSFYQATDTNNLYVCNNGVFVLIAGNASGTPQIQSLSCSPNAINFGAVQLNVQGPDRPFTCINTGTLPVTMQQLTITGSSDFHAEDLNFCTGQLLPGAGCTYQLFYKPTSVGASLSAAATAHSSAPIDPNNPTSAIANLSGSGTAIQTFPVSFNGISTGSGTITSDEATPLINCTIAPPAPPAGPCVANYASGATPVFTATPAVNNTFDGFSGGLCTLSPCIPTISGAATITASFTTISQVNFNLGITATGQGGATLVSDRSANGGLGILNCKATAGVVSSAGNAGCNGSFPQGYVITITETPDASSTFVGWSGPCTGTATTCVVTLNSSLTVNANFAPNTPGVSLVQTKTNCNVAGSTIGCVWGSAINATDLLMCVATISDASSTVSSVVDTSGNSYTQFPTISPKVGTGITQVGYYAQNVAAAAAGANTTTFTINTSVATSVSMTNLTSGSSNAGTTAQATASVTPTTSVVLLTATARLSAGNGPGPVTSVTGDGLTWVLYQALDYGAAVGTGKASRIEVWCGVGGSPTTGAITMNWTAAPSGTSWSVEQTTNAAATCAAAKGIVSVNNADVAAATPATTTMGTFGSASNATYGASSVDAGGVSIGQGAGFTELGSNNTRAPSVETEYAATNQTTVSTTFGSGPFKWGIIGIEIKSGGGGASRRDARCLDYAGLKTTGSPIDVSAAAVGTSAAPAAGSITTVSAADTLTGFTASTASSVSAVASGWTQRVKNSFGDDGEDQNNVAIGAYTFSPTLAASSNWVAFNVAWLNNGGSTSTTLSLTLGGSGNGQGTVTSNNGTPPINCLIQNGVATPASGGACSSIVSSGSSVTFTAAPNAGSSFAGWSGITGCSSSPVCTVPNITINQNITANFVLAGTLAYYVNASTGNDSRTPAQAQNPSTPWLTLQHANDSFTVGGSGTIIHVAAGTYAGNRTCGSGQQAVLCMTRGGTSQTTARVVWQCDTPATTAMIGTTNGCLIDNTRKDLVVDQLHISVEGSAANNLDVVGFHFATDPFLWESISTVCNNDTTPGSACTNLNSIHIIGNLAEPIGKSRVDFFCSDPNNHQRNGATFVVGPRHGHTINDVQYIGNIIMPYGDASCKDGYAMYAGGARSIIYNNITFGSSVALEAYAQGCGMKISNNTFIGYYDYGIQIWVSGGTSAGDVIACTPLGLNSIDNNIIDNGGVGVTPPNSDGGSGIQFNGECDTAHPTVVRNNVMNGNTHANFIGYNFAAVPACDQISGTITTETPANTFVNFLSSGLGDYRLKSTSQAVNAGTIICAPGASNCVPSTDIVGFPRPFGGAYDIGAYEFH